MSSISILEGVNQVRDQGKWILVFEGELVQFPTILYCAKCTILVFDEEERRSHGGLRRANASSPELFIQEVRELFLLVSTEGVYLAVES
jgi:hypothetical protein